MGLCLGDDGWGLGWVYYVAFSLWWIVVQFWKGGFCSSFPVAPIPPFLFGFFFIGRLLFICGAAAMMPCILAFGGERVPVSCPCTLGILVLV